jgi:hypothetical protein
VSFKDAAFVLHVKSFADFRSFHPRPRERRGNKGSRLGLPDTSISDAYNCAKHTILSGWSRCESETFIDRDKLAMLKNAGASKRGIVKSYRLFL